MGRFIDLTGQRFGRLFVVARELNNKHGHITWFCICDCGNTIIIIGTDLARTDKRAVKSCGCLGTSYQYFEELRQQEIGKFYHGCETLDAHSDRNGNDARTIVKVKCFCGNIFECRLRDLKRKKNPQKSCGCLRKLEEGEAAFNDIFYRYKESADRRNCIFELTKEEFREIIIQNCNYCNILPREIQYCKNFNGAFFGNGTDQVIAQGGYTKENCVSACTVCNHLKLDLSLEDWNLKLERITLKDYDNLLFDFNLEEVSEDKLKLQRGNFKKQKSHTKNQINTLTEQQYYFLATSLCFYCNAIPGNFNKRDSKDFYQSIDQKLARGGYVFKNCLPCCSSCNVAKNNMSYENFINHLKRLQQFQKALIVL
jgi:hypothetical protein